MDIEESPPRKRKGVTFKKGENLEIKGEMPDENDNIEENDGFFDNLEFGVDNDDFKLEFNEQGLYKSTPPKISQRLTLENVKSDLKEVKESPKKIKKIIKKIVGVKPKEKIRQIKQPTKNIQIKGPDVYTKEINSKTLKSTSKPTRRKRESSEDEICNIKEFYKSLKKQQEIKRQRTKRSSTVKEVRNKRGHNGKMIKKS